jgi:hypothetical protein
VFLPLAGCVGFGHKVGHIEADGLGATLRTPQGRAWDLGRGTEDKPVERLGGCIVEIHGFWIGSRFFVSDWRVTDGGDGTVPFVGHLRWHGGRLRLDDRSSGMPILFDLESEPSLLPKVGSMLLLSGYIVGPQTLHVMRVRVLREPGEGS